MGFPGEAMVAGLKRMRAVLAAEREAMMRPTPLHDDDYVAVTLAGDPPFTVEAVAGGHCRVRIEAEPGTNQA